MGGERGGDSSQKFYFHFETLLLTYYLGKEDICSLKFLGLVYLEVLSCLREVGERGGDSNHEFYFYFETLFLKYRFGKQSICTIKFTQTNFRV